MHSEDMDRIVNEYTLPASGPMTTSSIPSSGAPALPLDAYDRRFYGGMAVLIAMIVFVGFSPSFYLAPAFHRATPPPLRIVHGVMFSSWIVLFAVQTALITTGRVRWHMRLGIAGAVLAAGMVGIGSVVAVLAARAGHAAPGIDPLVFMAVPLFDMVVFTALVASAVYLRRRPQTHKRLMLLATASLVGAAAARLPLSYHIAGVPLFYAFGVVDALILMGVLYDVVTRHRVHPAYVWGGLLIVVSEPLRLAVGGTQLWRAFARFLIGL